jgi:hypothetical protein
MTREEQHLDNDSGADTKNSNIVFDEVIDYQAWKDTFPKVDPLPGEKSGTLEIPNLQTSNLATWAQRGKAGSDAATANFAAIADGGNKQEAAAKPLDNAAIKTLVAGLGSENFTTRRKATEQLEALGITALPHLQEAVNSDDRETRRRAQVLVDSALQKYAEPQSLDEWLDQQKELAERPTSVPKMLQKEWTPEQAKERSEALQILAQFKENTGYGNLDASELEKQAAEWADTKTTLGRVTDLDLSGPYITDDKIANIKNLPNLKKIDLSNSGVTDKSLANLKDLKQLTSLSLSHTKITDEGIAALNNLKQLEEVYLSATKVTDKCIDNLKELPNLRRMGIGGTGITDEAMKKLPAVGYRRYRR